MLTSESLFSPVFSNDYLLKKGRGKLHFLQCSCVQKAWPSFDPRFFSPRHLLVICEEKKPSLMLPCEMIRLEKLSGYYFKLGTFKQSAQVMPSSSAEFYTTRVHKVVYITSDFSFMNTFCIKGVYTCGHKIFPLILEVIKICHSFASQTQFYDHSKLAENTS